MTMDRADEIVGAAIAGEEPAFARHTERHRRELHVHCYRMLASFDVVDERGLKTVATRNTETPCATLEWWRPEH